MTTSALFSGLSITDASDSEIQAAKSRATLDTSHPVYAAFKATFDATDRSKKDWTGATKRAEISSTQVTKFEAAVRQSAAQLECGSGLRFRTPDGKAVDVVPFDKAGKLIPKPEKGKRAPKGTPTVVVDDKPYTGKVIAYFWPKYLRAHKARKPAAAAATATAAPAESAAATPTTPAKAAPAKVAPPRQ